MDEKQKILVSIGSAIACNCIPCYEHYWLKAKQAGICEEEVLEAVAIGEKVKSGAAVVMKETVDAIKNDEIPEDQLGANAPCICSQ